MGKIYRFPPIVYKRHLYREVCEGWKRGGGMQGGVRSFHFSVKPNPMLHLCLYGRPKAKVLDQMTHLTREPLTLAPHYISHYISWQLPLPSVTPDLYQQVLHSTEILQIVCPPKSWERRQWELLPGFFPDAIHLLNRTNILQLLLNKLNELFCNAVFTHWNVCLMSVSHILFLWNHKGKVNNQCE